MPFNNPNDNPNLLELQEYADQFNAIIAKTGFVVMMGEFPVSGGAVPLCYTVGLAAEGLPELVTFGLPHEHGRIAINNAAGKMRKGNLKCSVAQKQILTTDVYPMPVAPDCTDVLTLANQRAKRQVAAIQLVYSDARGRYPWDKGYSPQMSIIQPLLYQKPGTPTLAPVPATPGGDDPRLLAAPATAQTATTEKQGDADVSLGAAKKAGRRLQ